MFDKNAVANRNMHGDDLIAKCRADALLPEQSGVEESALTAPELRSEGIGHRVVYIQNYLRAEQLRY